VGPAGGALIETTAVYTKVGVKDLRAAMK